MSKRRQRPQRAAKENTSPKAPPAVNPHPEPFSECWQRFQERMQPLSREERELAYRLMEAVNPDTFRRALDNPAITEMFREVCQHDGFMRSTFRWHTWAICELAWPGDMLDRALDALVEKGEREQEAQDPQRALDRARAEYWHLLETMPYPLYLQTQEWQERRAAHLKAAYYRCQVCNAGNAELNVHHRTYARRGREWFKDLLVLCRACHTLFHREGRLAK